MSLKLNLLSSIFTIFRKDLRKQTHTQALLTTEYFTDIIWIFENQNSKKIYYLLQF